MSGARATCGRCGDSYEDMSSSVGDLRVERWRKEHERYYCRERTPDEVRAGNREMEIQAMCSAYSMKDLLDPDTKKELKEMLDSIEARYAAEASA